MTDFLTHDSHEPPQRRARRFALPLAGAALLAVGIAAGAGVMAETRPSVTMAPAVPVAIRTLADGRAIVTVRGQVAEVYGNKFVMADASGRALVDTGPEGDDKALVAPGQPVTVQGHFDRGFMHAAFLVGQDGKVTALGPLGGPPRHGPHGPGGPDRGPGAPPPPPPGGPAGNAPPPPPPADAIAGNVPPPPPGTIAPPAQAPAQR